MNGSSGEYIIENSNNTKMSSSLETNKISTSNKKKYKKLMQTIMNNNNEHLSKKINYSGLVGGEFKKVEKI
jgi:uncharacterized membrane protein YcgQ (UPF0703/DUF1980 family)